MINGDKIAITSNCPRCVGVCCHELCGPYPAATVGTEAKYYKKDDRANRLTNRVV